jgi:hypothetical protein
MRSAITTSHSAYIPSFAISIVYQLSEVAIIALLAHALTSICRSGCSVDDLQAVASLLPITFNENGVREAIFTAMILGQLGPEFKDDDGAR